MVPITQKNPVIQGSQPLTFFPRLEFEGALSDPTIRNLIRSGEPGDRKSVV